MKQNIAEPLSRLLLNGREFTPKVTHHFSDGICVREMFAPAGSIIVGAAHKTNHLTMMLRGTMQIRIGQESKIVQAPSTFEALAGSRKIGLALTDCIVSNIIPTDIKDIVEIEKLFTTMHEDELTKIKELTCQQP